MYSLWPSQSSERALETLGVGLYVLDGLHPLKLLEATVDGESSTEQAGQQRADGESHRQDEADVVAVFAGWRRVGYQPGQLPDQEVTHPDEDDASCEKAGNPNPALVVVVETVHGY